MPDEYTQRYVCQECRTRYEVRAGETVRCPGCGSKEREHAAIDQGPAPEGEPVEDVFSRVDRLCDQWNRNCGNLPPDAAHILKWMMRRVVLDAAKLCDQRAAITAKPMHVRNEATKCGSSIRHWLLCGEDQQVCVPCDGEGCVRCRHRGVIDLPSSPGSQTKGKADGSA